ncbi:MAG: hypothetical protein M3362_12485, partial [Acidobacteriota bacterium]|nr:hypothetical protein [Acidobacteriota bacterium]
RRRSEVAQTEDGRSAQTEDGWPATLDHQSGERQADSDLRPSELVNRLPFRSLGTTPPGAEDEM